MTKLEQVLAEITEDIRRKFSRANISEVFLEITISGRTDASGPLQIHYNIGKSYASGLSMVTDLDAGVHEYMRRHGWDQTQDTKFLAAPERRPYNEYGEPEPDVSEADML